MGYIFLIKLIKNFGLKGIDIYRKLKNPQSTFINIPGYDQKFYIRPNSKDKSIFNHIILEEDYDIELRYDPKVIIDCGSYTGFSSVFFAKKYPKAKIICLEPDASNFSFLKKNTAKYDNIFIYNKAIWHTKTSLRLENIDKDKCSVFVSEKVSDDNKFNHEIESVTINDLLVEHNVSDIDILKLDIEGAEKELFINNHEWLKNVKTLVIELHDRKRAGCSKALFAALQKFDFISEVKSEYLIIKFISNGSSID
jgi:FkbM family methyltransferase